MFSVHGDLAIEPPREAFGVLAGESPVGSHSAQSGPEGSPRPTNADCGVSSASARPVRSGNALKYNTFLTSNAPLPMHYVRKGSVSSSVSVVNANGHRKSAYDS